MKFDYGQAVGYKTVSETGVVMIKIASVVSITLVGTTDQAEAFGFPIGTVMYQIEFGDGSDILVPEQELDGI